MTTSLAQTKLAALLAASNPTALAVRVGSSPATIRQLAAGLVRPKAATIERFVPLGIAPGDWFTQLEVA